MRSYKCERIYIIKLNNTSAVRGEFGVAMTQARKRWGLRSVLFDSAKIRSPIGLNWS